MASKIIVDQLEKTGGALTALTLPLANATANQYIKNDGAGALSWATLPGSGKVLQVLQSVKKDTTSTTVSGGTWADITGTDQAGAGSIWCVKITPSATTSKILCMFTVSYGAATDKRTNWRLLRDSATPVLGDAAGSRIPVTIGGQATYNWGTSNGGYIYLDSPVSTSELTYKVQWDLYTGSLTMYLNRSAGETDTSEYNRATSQITVMEIGA